MDGNLVLDTSVEDVRHLKHGQWQLTLRRRDAMVDVDSWWQETFDALVIANGHYAVPFVSDTSCSRISEASDYKLQADNI